MDDFIPKPTLWAVFCRTPKGYERFSEAKPYKRALREFESAVKAARKLDCKAALQFKLRRG